MDYLFTFGIKSHSQIKNIVRKRHIGIGRDKNKNYRKINKTNNNELRSFVECNKLETNVQTTIEPGQINFEGIVTTVCECLKFKF